MDIELILYAFFGKLAILLAKIALASNMFKVFTFSLNYHHQTISYKWHHIDHFHEYSLNLH